MSEYIRPAIKSRVFYDENGRVIDYGARWPDSPPEESYSVTAHPERFAPLHTVVDALVQYLVNNYQVRVDEGVHLLETLGAREFSVPGPDEVDRVVRLTPNDGDCSPLSFICTSYPGVRVAAGEFGVFYYPNCGCDACDETWDSAAQAMEEDALAVISGGYREMVDLIPLRKIGYQRSAGISVGPGRTYGWEIKGPDMSFSRSSVGDASGIPVRTLKAVNKRLKELTKVTPNGYWKAWERRNA
ncbi:DUF6226 family protein [Actinomycetaceae bacterium MB13-C1-2]|nr:DUF6226 family protein [Actinomycetaceae bacterium MB13-C1-2]